jgi:hypothetical protein
MNVVVTSPVHELVCLATQPDAVDFEVRSTEALAAGAAVMKGCQRAMLGVPGVHCPLSTHLTVDSTQRGQRHQCQ